jgi:hypothetical protein
MVALALFADGPGDLFGNHTFVSPGQWRGQWLAYDGALDRATFRPSPLIYAPPARRHSLFTVGGIDHT